MLPQTSVSGVVIVIATFGVSRIVYIIYIFAEFKCENKRSESAENLQINPVAFRNVS